MSFGELIAVFCYAYADAESARMDDELKTAKNKKGIFQKYMSQILPRAKPDYVGDPFAVDASNHMSNAEHMYMCAYWGIQMSMYDRLINFQKENQLVT